YSSLLSACKDVDIPRLSPANLLVDLTRLQYVTTKPRTYVDSFLSLGHPHSWSCIHHTNSHYQDLTPSLATDLKDGHLDGKQHIG
ncbi:hypothetical protein NQU43_19390, partial [Acinetobacter baumannii]|nr:hypothetical protein [Acinetobacter baumannii]